MKLFLGFLGILISVSALGATFTGNVIEIQKDAIVVKNGKKVMHFKRDEKELKLPPSISRGQKITITYSQREHARAMQEAGQVAPKEHIIRDDRIFYGA